VTWRLVSFAYLQIGMLQAIAGFYAYFTVLGGFGFRPGHLMGLDEHRVFNDARSPDKLRDGYYLWCFEPDYNTKCFYLPNFYYGVYENQGAALPYYNDEFFQSWKANKEDFVKEAKDFLVDVADEMSLALTRDMLDAGSELTWEQFEALYWKSENESDEASMFGYLSQRTYHAINAQGTVLYPTRFCFDEDYAMFYTDGENMPPPFCNVEGNEYQPRTFEYTSKDDLGRDIGQRSLFPMQTRARVEALGRSNSAYFISIIVVQWADLMICKTRVKSLFDQGMTNTFMNYALLFETILGAFLVYVPVANTVTGTRPLRFTWWTAAIPFSLMIYIYDEVRKGWIRSNRNGWLHRNTFW